MAEVWTHKFDPYAGTYDRETMTYIWTRRYGVTGCVVALPVPGLLRRSPSATTYPEWIEFTHTIYRLKDGIAGGIKRNQMVYCFPGNLRVVNMPSKTCLEVDVTYMGRVCGTHGLHSRTQMASEVRYESLEPDGDGTYKGIGVEFEGVPVDVPMIIHTAIQVLPFANYASMANLEDVLAGSVNEQNWIAPWEHMYPQGSVIYLGPRQALVDRRTQTVTIYHVFARMQNRRHQHVFRWREYEQHLSDEGQKIRKYKTGEMAEGKILKIAGTDLWWDNATPIPRFNDLSLEYPIV